MKMASVIVLRKETGMEVHSGIKAVAARSGKEWRKWLEKNHAREKCVWLIIYGKKSNKKSIYYDEAVEEALCFGWIDSKGNKRDEESYYLYFAPRNPKSKWSKINKKRVESLISRGLMTPAGLKMITLARETGTWDALTDIDNIVVPDDLNEMLRKNKKAFEYFEAFPPSSRRIILEWISNAKRPETRQKRIRETVALAATNKRANHNWK
jgi:uncharacterized protein YdeI (YjbR/CyaY-like superfamily)